MHTLINKIKNMERKRRGRPFKELSERKIMKIAVLLTPNQVKKLESVQETMSSESYSATFRRLLLNTYDSVKVLA